jgi:hypothetical protein
MSAAPPDQPPAQEVRVSEYARRALSRWYVIVLAVIVAVGLVVLQGANKAKGQVDATATVYMGQPVTPGGGALFANPPYANLSAVTALINSGAARAVAAAAANAVPGKTKVDASSLSGKVTAHQISSGGSSTAGKPATGPAYYSIEAQGPWSTHQVGAIANSLAGIVVHKANAYVSAKTAALQTEIATAQAAIVRLQAGIKTDQATAAALAPSAGTDPAKAALLATLLSQVSADTTVVTETQAQLSQNQLSLASAVNIEAASIANFGAGHSVTAQRKRSSLIVAAVGGLIIGTLLALAWDALRRRQKSNGPAEGASA